MRALPEPAALWAAACNSLFEGRAPELGAYTSPYPTSRFHSVNVKSGQQTGSKRLESRCLNHAESDRKKAEKPHEQSDSASIVANRRDRRTGLSRRRSRVRVPSLPLLC
jgi:hypothetical protein